MSVFAYNPDSARTWANSVVNYLNGGGESVSACSKQFNEQVEKLVQPNVWTGSAAAQNYQNFMDTHNALIKFINSFGDSFQEAMNSVNKSVANLETSNLGADTNVSSAFGNLSYDQLATLSEENVNKSEVRYDYATISSIGSALKNIESSLENIHTGLKSKIQELNSGASIWDGDAAESAKNNLINTLESNMKQVFESLNICISNISKAAEAAQIADSGR